MREAGALYVGLAFLAYRDLLGQDLISYRVARVHPLKLERVAQLEGRYSYCMSNYDAD